MIVSGGTVYIVTLLRPEYMWKGAFRKLPSIETIYAALELRWGGNNEIAVMFHNYFNEVPLVQARKCLTAGEIYLHGDITIKVSAEKFFDWD